jgi:hypothetical protein
MGKKFIAVKSKFYKNENASGEMAHVDRLFKENVNSFSEYSDDNFGSDYKLYDRYKELHQQRNAIRKSRKDSTTYIDSVLVFSLEQWEFLEEKHTKTGLRKGMKKMMDDYLQAMKDRHGLEPIGYKFHLDEGHEKQFEAYTNQQERIKNDLLKDDEIIIEKADLVRNIHAHVMFYNFDFEKKISPWRKIGKKQTSEMQDIAAKCFKGGDFERGISKSITKKQGQNKEQFVDEKINKLEQKSDELDLLISKKEHVIVDLDSSIASKEDYHFNLVDRVAGLKDQEKTYITAFKDTFNNFKTKLSILVKSLLESDSRSSDNEINDVQSVINKSYDDFDDQSIGDHLTDSANETVKRDLDKPFKKKKPKL